MVPSTPFNFIQTKKLSNPYERLRRNLAKSDSHTLLSALSEYTKSHDVSLLLCVCDTLQSACRQCCLYSADHVVRTFMTSDLAFEEVK